MTPARAPLDRDRVHSLLADGGWPGPLPVLLPTIGSTNAEAARLVEQGAPEGSCVVAEEQTAGRGRHERVWVSPEHGGLWMSVVLRPSDVPRAKWGWIPLLAGLAVRDAIRAVRVVPVGLKWPNDLVVQNAACGGAKGTMKLGGILSEVVAPDAVVVGIGINVSLMRDELPTAEATSLLLEGGSTDREELLAWVLVATATRVAQWRAGDPALARDYREACVTIGRLVDVALPEDGRLHGVVSGIDDDGHLLVESDGHTRTVTAGDVIHATI